MYTVQVAVKNKFNVSGTQVFTFKTGSTRGAAGKFIGDIQSKYKSKDRIELNLTFSVIDCNAFGSPIYEKMFVQWRSAKIN
jgi:hypothetical protein